MPLNLAEVTFDYPAISDVVPKPPNATVGKFMGQETFLKTWEIKAPKHREIKMHKQAKQESQSSRDRSDAITALEQNVKMSVDSILRGGVTTTEGEQDPGAKERTDEAMREDLEKGASFVEEVVLPKVRRPSCLRSLPGDLAPPALTARPASYSISL